MRGKENYLHEKFGLSGKVAIVTGALGDIGQEICHAFHSSGATVYGLDTKNADESVDFSVIKCDVTNYEQTKVYLKQIYEEHGRIDVLVNNAGVTYGRDEDGAYPIERWRKTLVVNLESMFVLCEQVFAFMKEKGGSIINISSIAAEMGSPGNPAYGAAKGGVKSLTRSLANEWGKDNIRVNTVGPGYIGMGMTTKSFDDPKIKKERESAMILKKWNTAEDVALSCVFLASDASGYITGQDIYVDGGWTVKCFPDFEECL